MGKFILYSFILKNHLYFYSDSLDQGWDTREAQDRVLPVKVSCSHCRTPIADEGRHMWLAFATLFGFTIEGGDGGIPESFRFVMNNGEGVDGADPGNSNEKNTAVMGIPCQPASIRNKPI